MATRLGRKILLWEFDLMSIRRSQSLIALVSLVSFVASQPLLLCASVAPAASAATSVLPNSSASPTIHEPACHCSACQSQRAQPSAATSESPNDECVPSEQSPLAPKSGFPCGPTGCCLCNAAKAPCCPPLCDLAVFDVGLLSYLCVEATDTYRSPFASLLTRPPRS